MKIIHFLRYIFFLCSLIVIHSCAGGGSSDRNKQTKEVKEQEQPRIGDPLSGDFNGDGRKETAQIHLVKAGVFQEEPWHMSVDFSDNSLPSINITCDQDYFTLMNEGDLNNIPGDEFSILLPPANGNWLDLTPYTLDNGKWEILFEGFLTPSSILFLDENDELDSTYIPYEARIFKENDSIYYYLFQNFELPTGEQEFRFVKVRALLQ